MDSLVSAEEAHQFCRVSPNYDSVVRPYLSGDDITNHPSQKPSRWIIDFDGMELEDAMGFPDALDIVRARVKPCS